MFHEEQVIDGKLCWRATPDGEFIAYNQEQLTALVLIERKRRKDILISIQENLG